MALWRHIGTGQRRVVGHCNTCENLSTLFLNKVTNIIILIITLHLQLTLIYSENFLKYSTITIEHLWRDSATTPTTDTRTLALNDTQLQTLRNSVPYVFTDTIVPRTQIIIYPEVQADQTKCNNYTFPTTMCYIFSL